jgi:insulysin
MQFFIAPRISRDGIARERQAVDAEHSKNLLSDGWRQQRLWQEIAHPSSHYSRFFTGNLETLGIDPEAAGIDVHKELVAFWEREYSANRMKLCVLGRQALDELQALVEEQFGAVLNKGAPCGTRLQP